MLGEVGERFISLLSPFDRTQGLVCGGKVGQSLLKNKLDQEALIIPGKVNAMNNCARCSEGLRPKRWVEVGMQIISLLSPFDRTQGLVCGG